MKEITITLALFIPIYTLLQIVYYRQLLKIQQKTGSTEHPIGKNYIFPLKVIKLVILIPMFSLLYADIIEQMQNVVLTIMLNAGSAFLVDHFIVNRFLDRQAQRNFS